MVSGGGNAAAVDLPGYVLKIHPSGQSGGLERQAVPPRKTLMRNLSSSSKNQRS